LNLRNLANNRTLIPIGQTDKGLYQPAPIYGEVKLTYHF
jgi:hypothetical protein